MDEREKRVCDTDVRVRTGHGGDTLKKAPSGREWPGPQRPDHSLGRRPDGQEGGEGIQSYAG